jgi:hypothetical protein
MICDRARRLFGACWDDELTQAERDWLDTHFTSCPRCRAEYDEFSRALEWTASLPRAEAAPDLVDRVLAHTRRTAPAPDVVGERGARWVPAAVVAAAAALVVAVLFVMPHTVWRTPSLPNAATLAASITKGPPEPVMVQRVTTAPRRPAQHGAVTADNLFDPSKDVEFVLDPVTLHRGRATVTTGIRREARGQQAIITF